MSQPPVRTDVLDVRGGFLLWWIGFLVFMPVGLYLAARAGERRVQTWLRWSTVGGNALALALFFLPWMADGESGVDLLLRGSALVALLGSTLLGALSGGWSRTPKLVRAGALLQAAAAAVVIPLFLALQGRALPRVPVVPVVLSLLLLMLAVLALLRAHGLPRSRRP